MNLQSHISNHILNGTLEHSARTVLAEELRQKIQVEEVSYSLTQRISRWFTVAQQLKLMHQQCWDQTLKPYSPPAPIIAWVGKQEGNGISGLSRCAFAIIFQYQHRPCLFCWCLVYTLIIFPCSKLPYCLQTMERECRQKSFLNCVQVGCWASKLSTRAIELAQLQILTSHEDSAASDIFSLLVLHACKGIVFLFASPAVEQPLTQVQLEGGDKRQTSRYARVLQFLEEVSLSAGVDYFTQPSR